jgi:hypothetical protein
MHEIAQSVSCSDEHEAALTAAYVVAYSVLGSEH